MTNVLEVEDLSIGYNNHLAVEKISFDVVTKCFPIDWHNQNI